MPPLFASVGQVYAYNATATDPDNDLIEWKLLAAPDGMSVDPIRGTVRWVPAADQVGSQIVTLQAAHPYGGQATQTWTITLAAGNLPPVILSTPPTTASTGATYVTAASR